MARVLLCSLMAIIGQSQPNGAPLRAASRTLSPTTPGWAFHHVCVTIDTISACWKRRRAHEASKRSWTPLRSTSALSALRMDTAPWERGGHAGGRRTTGMHIGLMMECDFREGGTPREAFDEAFATAEAAEALGFDGIWLAERHFAALGTSGASGRGSRHAG